MSTIDSQEEIFSSQLDWRLWRKLLGHGMAFRKELGILLASGAASAGCEVFLTMITKWAIDDLASGGLDRSLPFYGGIYLGTILVIAICIWNFIYFGGIIATGVSHNIRAEGFRRLQQLEISYFDKRPSGWLLTRLTSDCDRLARIVAWGVLDLFWGLLMVTLIATVLLFLHWKLALVVLAVVPPLIWLSVIFQRRLLFSSREVRKVNSEITASFNENIMGARTTKSLVREERNLREFEQLTSRMYTTSVRSALQSAVYMPIVFTLGAAATGLALWQGGGLVLGGAMTLGTLVAFMSYTGQFFNPVNQIARILTEVQSSQAAAERVLSLIETEPAIRDCADREEETIEGGETAPAGLPAQIGTIRFEAVNFRYEPEVPVLRNFDLTVNAGETIALVGPSGGGKSTIVNLLGRFYEPTDGRITIDGIDYRRRSLEWLRSNLGIVLQAPHLFNGTVRENIRYGRLEATDAEVEEAARLVNAHEFVTQLADGYETRVGEGGNRLSTGQKQLISFARAVLANPQIFIMDEATSSVDAETEDLIQQSLQRILQGRISFIIAHRLSTVRAADRILFIRDGQIAESGSHVELMARRGGLYRQLYHQQFQNKREMELLLG